LTGASDAAIVRRNVTANFGWSLGRAAGTFLQPGYFGRRCGRAAHADKYWIYVLAYLVAAAAGACYALRPGGASAEILCRGVTDE
jgi:hypothetical protein